MDQGDLVECQNGEVDVAFNATRNHFILNKICLNQHQSTLPVWDMVQWISENVTDYHVALVDGMAEPKSLSNPENVKTYVQLADQFCSHALDKFDMMDEVHIGVDHLISYL